MAFMNIFHQRNNGYRWSLLNRYSLGLLAPVQLYAKPKEGKLLDPA
jgi:hypothetical protein